MTPSEKSRLRAAAEADALTAIRGAFSVGLTDEDARRHAVCQVAVIYDFSLDRAGAIVDRVWRKHFEVTEPN